MLLDLTVPVSPQTVRDAQGNERKAMTGHLGTHFDGMDREFPLEYTRRRGHVFDVREVPPREIGPGDVDLLAVREGMFVAFCTGWLEEKGYGSQEYFHGHPVLSRELIEALVELRVSIIGADLPGIRRGPEHTPADQYCADHGVFVVENLCSLQRLLEEQPDGRFEASTYPVRFGGMTGLPCRVVAREL